jgi:glycosyltransferase involved in cell wall biosynthesis
MVHDGESAPDPVRAQNGCSPALLVATILREEGVTGVHTHVRELRRHVDECGLTAALVTPFCWGGLLRLPVFGVRPALDWWSTDAGVAWYRFWHEIFLRNALRAELSNIGPAVIYAQGPEAARASLRARRGPDQRVVMAVHYQSSQADGWVDKKRIKPGGFVYRAIKRMEKDVIPRVDGIVYVSNWARDCLLKWLPEAGALPSAVIPNFVKPIELSVAAEPYGDLVSVGSLEPVKHHEFLLQVLAEAKRAGQTFTLDLFGDGPLRKELERSARLLGIEDQVRFRGYHADVRKYLGGYRAYVHACPSETGPLAIIEAMAAGLPILAPNSGGSSQLYEDGVEGRFWPLDDASEAAAILVDTLSPPKVSDFSAAASQRFQRNFDAKILGQRLLSFLLSHGIPVGAEDPRCSRKAAKVPPKSRGLSYSSLRSR